MGNVFPGTEQSQRLASVKVSTTVGRGWRWGLRQVCGFILPQKCIKLLKSKREVKEGRYFVQVYLKN